MAGEYRTTYEIHPGWTKIDTQKWIHKPEETPVYIEAALNTLGDWLSPPDEWTGEAIRISPDSNHPEQVEFVLYCPRPPLSRANALNLNNIINPKPINPVDGVFLAKTREFMITSPLYPFPPFGKVDHRRVPYFQQGCVLKPFFLYSPSEETVISEDPNKLHVVVNLENPVSSWEAELRRDLTEWRIKVDRLAVLEDSNSSEIEKLPLTRRIRERGFWINTVQVLQEDFNLLAPLKIYVSKLNPSTSCTHRNGTSYNPLQKQKRHCHIQDKDQREKK